MRLKHEKEKYKVMYHVGMQLPLPIPLAERYASYRNLPDRGVFLSPNWRDVVLNHHIVGHVYAYRVPMEAIKASGGINRFDKASEMVITEEWWPSVQLLGKTEDYREVARFMLNQRRTKERRWANDFINAGKDELGYIQEYVKGGYDFGEWAMAELPMPSSRRSYWKKSPKFWPKRNPQ